MRRLPLAITVAMAILTICGLMLGEPSEVYRKAINLCLSCIGIG